MTDLSSRVPGLTSLPSVEGDRSDALGDVSGEWITQLDYSVVAELRARVASRLDSDEAGVFRRLDEESQVEFTRSLAADELTQWIVHQQTNGRPIPTEEVEDEILEATVAAATGMGRLEPLLRRTDIEDIFYNGAEPTMLRLSDGSMVQGPSLGDTTAEVQALIQRAASQLGDGASREYSAANPLLAVRLKSIGDLGARLSAAMDVTPFPAGTIRIHRHAYCDLDILESMGMVDAPLKAFLRALVQAQGKVAISGGTGFGKTTFLRGLCSEIPMDKMIVTIEDDRELGLHALKKRDLDGNVVLDSRGRPVPLRPPALVRAYEGRPANSEGRGAVTMDMLGYQALRDSPDVLIFGEARGQEFLVILEGLSNGIGGIMFTLHATSATGVFDRAVQLVRKAQPPLPGDYAMRALSYADVIVQIKRDRYHRRYVSEVIELIPGLTEQGLPNHEYLFAPGPDGRAIPTGRHLSAELAERLEDVGFDPSWLRPERSTWAPFGEPAARRAS